jgi:hypothetical protein
MEYDDPGTTDGSLLLEFTDVHLNQHISDVDLQVTLPTGVFVQNAVVNYAGPTTGTTSLATLLSEVPAVEIAQPVLPTKGPRANSTHRTVREQGAPPSRPIALGLLGGGAAFLAAMWYLLRRR